MFEVICREIKIMLVDTWVLGLTLEVCLIYFLGMAVLSNWQNNKAISVGERRFLYYNRNQRKGIFTDRQRIPAGNTG